MNGHSFSASPRNDAGWYALRVSFAHPIWAQIAPAETGRVLELAASWILLGGGASALLTACTFLGLAAWAGERMRPSGAATVLLRWAIGGAGTLLLGTGIILLGGGLEGALDRPLGDMTGTPSLFGWWVALRVASGDAMMTATLARRLAQRTGSLFDRALAGWALIVAGGARMTSVLVGAALAIVGIALLGQLIAP